MGIQIQSLRLLKYKEENTPSLPTQLRLKNNILDHSEINMWIPESNTWQKDVYLKLSFELVMERKLIWSRN